MSTGGAASLLKALYRDLKDGEYLELRTIHPQGVVRQYFFTSSSALVSAARKLSSVNVYYGLGVRRGKIGDKEHTASVGAAFADVDFKVFPDREQGAMDALAHFPLPPSAVIHSGGGLQALWLLREAAEPEEFPKLEAVNRGLTVALAPEGKRLDSAIDASRVFRLPDTANLKYTPPVTTRLAELRTERRYTLSDLAEWLPIDYPPVAPVRSNNGSSPHTDDGLSVDQIIGLARKAKNGPKFISLFEQGDLEPYQGDDSRADLALVSEIAFWTGPDPAKIEAVFNQSTLSQREKWQREDYRARTIAAALEGRTEFYTPPAPRPVLAPSVAHASTPSPAPTEFAEEAYYGITGEVTRAIAPHTEACDAAVLISFLEAAGNSIGRGPHAIAEADRHGCNLFAVLVGDTSKGRKGSSWGHVCELFSRVDPSWAGSRIMGGLSSGEGLIWAVRDPIYKKEVVREKGRATGEYETVMVDPGVDDKRLLALEPEFASVLKVMTRESNILSTQMRQAFDKGDLRTLTKNNPAVATAAHISILGHITKDELLRCLTDTEAGNGFANRFLWTWAFRSKVLPEGGGEPPYQRLVPTLHDALERARSVGRLQRNAETKEAWASVYPALSEGKPGLLGAVTARAEAQVLRLSVLYAALDGADAIGLPHLKAALAVWEYCEASARHIFGNALGDPVADQILAALAQSELTRTQIYNMFGRNVPSARIAQALILLLTHGQARFEQRDSEGRGRPTEVWMRT